MGEHGPATGTVIGQYALEAELDEGEFATVFRARHAVLDTSHALKILHPGQEEPIVQSLLSTARLQALVDHPNIVRVSDAGFFRGRAWLVSDWVEGRSLADRLDAEGAMQPGPALDVFRGIVRGAYALHRSNVVHRDLKPSNVLLAATHGGTPKINDLHLAKFVEKGRSPTAMGLSVEYRTLGTPEYMAPEQASNVGEVDARADLWSLGVVLYEMLTNAVPFEGHRAVDTQLLALRGRYMPLSERLPGAPEKLDLLVRDLLKAVGERIQSAGELLRRLDAV